MNREEFRQVLPNRYYLVIARFSHLSRHPESLNNKTGASGCHCFLERGFPRKTAATSLLEQIFR
jgi:hypothetical protein